MRKLSLKREVTQQTQPARAERGAKVPTHFIWPPLVLAVTLLTHRRWMGALAYFFSSRDGFPCTIHAPLRSAWAGHVPTACPAGGSWLGTKQVYPSLVSKAPDNLLLPLPILSRRLGALGLAAAGNAEPCTSLPGGLVHIWQLSVYGAGWQNPQGRALDPGPNQAVWSFVPFLWKPSFLGERTKGLECVFLSRSQSQLGAAAQGQDVRIPAT